MDLSKNPDHKTTFLHFYVKQTARVGTPAVFLSNWQILHFWAVFSAFPVLGGISYHPAAKSVLNRIFEKNNDFV